MISYAIPNDVYASLEGGGSISVEEHPAGGIEYAAALAEKRGNITSTLLLSLSRDPDGPPLDTVWFHPDQSARLELIRKARAALDAAEAALEAVGWMDDAHLRTQDYRTPAQRERNAFELGRDSVSR